MAHISYFQKTVVATIARIEGDIGKKLEELDNDSIWKRNGYILAILRTVFKNSIPRAIRLTAF